MTICGKSDLDAARKTGPGESRSFRSGSHITLQNKELGRSLGSDPGVSPRHVVDPTLLFCIYIAQIECYHNIESS